MECLKDKIVKTRKPHNCWGCCRKFQKGSDRRYIVSVDGGSFSGSYWCKVCDSVVDDLESWERYDGFSYGAIKDNCDEWGERKEKIEGEL